MLLENQEIEISTKHTQRIDSHNLFRRQITLVDERGIKTNVYACSLQTITWQAGDEEDGNTVKSSKIVECDTFDCKKCILATPHYQGGV